MYMTYLSPQKTFIGQWVGSGYDGDLMAGYVVIKKNRNDARAELEAFIKAHPQDIRLIYNAGVA